MDNSQYAINPDEHLGLVHSCVKRFVGKGIEYDDLYQAGCVGLVKAAKGFDHGRGLQFSTYAVTVILGEIRHQFRSGGSVKVSRTLKELSMNVERERERQTKLLGREPAISEIAAAMNLTAEEVSEAIASSKAVYSIEKMGEDDSPKIEIADKSREENIIDRLSIENAMKHLTPEDRKLIELRYYNDKTQGDTARVLGISQVQVSRRERVILMKMRDILSA